MLYLSPQSPFEPGSGLGDLRMPRGRPVKGVAAVAGAAVGPVFLHARTEIVVPERTITQDEVPAEIARLQQAKTNAVRELNELHTVAAEQLSERDAKAILTQVAMIADLTNMVTSSMKKDLRNVEAIFEKACQFFIGHYEKAEDPNLRAKSNDTRDIRNRILGHLLGQTSLSQVLLGEGQPPAVLVTPYLLPTEVFLLSPERVLAVCTDQGGPRDHTAVMCRMKGIPLVAGLADLSLNVAPGQEVAVDGFNGVVTIEPDDQAKSNLRATQKQYEIRSLQRPLSKNGARTRDRVPVTILANVERLQDVIRLKSKAIGGVGLFRSEFLFLERDTPPTEDDQYATFMAAAQAMHPRPLTIRTMDFGDDKWPRWDRLREKMGGNFAYGPKGIRLSLASEQNENIFRAHCRAILRASTSGNVRIMYPSINDAEEFKKALGILHQEMEVLKAVGLEFNPKIKVGTMIETPSAVHLASQLAQVADFFSIGTNDLTQSFLGIGRNASLIGHGFDEAHPAVLRCIRDVCRVGIERGIPVSVCGDAASDPLLVPFLLAAGVRIFSVSEHNAPNVNHMIGICEIPECERLLEEVLDEAGGVGESRARLSRYIPVLRRRVGLE